MARMPTFDEIRNDFERGVHAAEQRIEQPFRRHQTSAAQAAADPSQQSQPEAQVSAVAEAKNILHDVLAKLETVDEAGQAAIEAIRVNPIGISIVNTVASIAHLSDPDGILAAIDNMLKTGAAVLVHAAQATAPADDTGMQPVQGAAAQPNVIR